ncbi:MAG: VWA domain-containing protein, partial [bacterium]|nr:VWA domain-containing protein [bacterium]
MPGIFPEVAAYVYGQIAEVYKLDNEFAARWASWAFAQDNRDLKVALAAFMLVQDRKGEPVRGSDGKIEFCDDDFRDVGEAMMLLRGNGKDLNPKLLLRVGDLLTLPQVAEINRKLGFGKSAREAFLGRYPKVVEKWLRFRERNPRMLTGLVKAGFRSTVKRLCVRVGFKPESVGFFQALRWKQKQAKDGRRGMAIGDEVAKAESWEGLTERQICNQIKKGKPNWKRIVGMLPVTVGVTRAVVACAIESGSLSDQDMIILTPTLEELGLLTDPSVSARWAKATQAATNQRAANVAQRVRKQATAEKLQEVADQATAKALVEVTKGLRVYVVVDKSGSMENSLEAAKGYLTRLLVGFPMAQLHVSVFNTVGTEILLKAASAVAVAQAFRGHTAGGGTYHHEGVQAIIGNKPGPNEDAIFLFVGDEGEANNPRMVEVFR